MASREQVLAAYQNNPLADPTPDEGAIQYWMQAGLGNFDQVVSDVRAANPALAAQIDAERSNKQVNITALGDSTTWGYNSGEQVQKNMVTTAQEELSKNLGKPVDIINRGENGATLGDVINNGGLFSAANDPSNIVVLNFGLNEAYRKVNPEEFKQNILDAAGYLKNLGKTVVLQTPNFTSNPEIQNVGTYANIVREVANQYGLTLDDKYASTESATFSNSDLTHPTAEVYQNLGKSLANTLSSVISQSSSNQNITTQATPTGKAAVEFALANAQDPTSLQLPYGTELFAGEQGGTRYSVAGDRVIAVTPGPTGIGAQQQIYDLSGNLLEDTFIENYGKRSGMTDAIVTALAAAALGPGVIGLSAPAAAATASGLFNYSATGDLENALKAALLAGATAYGAQSLFGGSTPAVDDFVAADVAQLAAQGIPEEQIAQILSQQGVPSTVLNAALDAQFGTSAPGSAAGLGDFSTLPSDATVPVTGYSLVGPSFSTVSPIALGSILGSLQTTTPSLNPPAGQSVAVEGTKDTTGPSIAPVGSIVGSLLTPGVIVPGGTGGQVVVEGSRIPGSTGTPATSIGGIVGSLLTPPPTVPPATTPTPPPGAPEQVTVKGTREKPPVFEPVFPIIPTIVPPGVPPMVPPTPPAPPPAGPDLKGLLTPNNLLGLLSLLGATGAVTGTTTPPPVGVPPSDTNIGSTTPQFGPDYYAAVQRYYNAYMPETPRNVAGPLQQWYENKYGA